MKKILIVSAALAATAATVYLLKRKRGTEQVVEEKTPRARHRTEVFSKAKGFHNQHAMG